MQLVGIDASRAVADSPTGTETFSRALITALLQLETPLRFRLYTRSAPPAGLFPPTGNYEIRTIPFPRAWTHVRLSAEMLTRAPDALFVPAHVLPLIHPRRSFVTVHDLGYIRFPQAHRALDRRYLDLSTRWNVRAATRVFADSRATALDLEEFYRVPPQKITVVYPGCDAGRFHSSIPASTVESVRARFRLSADYMLAVGTLQPRKNYERLVRAWARLPGETQLVIAGRKGWLPQNILAAAGEAGLAERVRLLEYVPPADLPALYRGASVFVFPSLYEGFGLPILEAQACGVPVACSNTSSLPEAAGEGALLFDPLSVESIRATLARLLADEALRQDLIARGAENVKRFSWEKSARAVCDVLIGTR